MKYNNLYTIVNDICDEENEIIILDLDIYDGKDFITTHSLKLDLKKMGLSSDMDYAFQLSKDVNNIVVNYYEENNKLPSINEIENQMHSLNYFVIELPRDEINNETKEKNIEEELIYEK